MKALLLFMFGWRETRQRRSRAASVVYAIAMRESEDLVSLLRGHVPEPVQAIIREVWQRRDDMAYLATVHEAAEEAATPKAIWE